MFEVLYLNSTMHPSNMSPHCYHFVVMLNEKKKRKCGVFSCKFILEIFYKTEQLKVIYNVFYHD